MLSQEHEGSTKVVASGLKHCPGRPEVEAEMAAGTTGVKVDGTADEMNDGAE